MKGVDAPNWKLGIETLGLRYDIYKLSFLLSNYGNESPLKVECINFTWISQLQWWWLIYDILHYWVITIINKECTAWGLV